MSDWTMDRRAFLEHATVSGSVAVVGPVLPALARAVSRPTERVAAPFELEEATIAGLQAGLESGKYTARSLVTAYLQRIEELDRKGPALLAVLEANPDALARAAARHPGSREGQCRDAGSDAEHGRLARARGGGAPAGRLPGRAAAGRGRRPAGQSEPLRVGQIGR